MAKKTKALGKGLSALIPESIEAKDSGIIELKITDIVANETQPRRTFGQDTLSELAESIKEHGVVQPIVVRKDGKGYEIVAGERRWRAARLAGIKTIPVVVKDYSKVQAMEIALIENLQREDLNPIEEANAYRTLMEEHKVSQDDIAKRIGKSRPKVANTLRLLNLNEEVRELLISGELSAGHGRALLAISNEARQLDIAKRIVKEGLNVRQTEKMSQKTVKKNKKPKSPEIVEIEGKLRDILHTKVSLTHGRKKGKIEIEYYSNDDLERIINLIEKK
ncbi:MAG: ParB/RepB/Spo0J family partition protein [Clostridiales bacterium]|nr:ParB/RepB/Spo0J family partition protein [Clostridiales bacterium]